MLSVLFRKALMLNKTFISVFIQIRTRLNKGTLPSWTILLALAVIVILSYGLRISNLGFYWDGWVFIHYYNKLGPDRFQEIMGYNRPLTAFLYSLTIRIFKDIPIRWQIFGLLSRWTSAVALWWALRELWQVIWPKRNYQVTWIVLLFVIYPSFTQQSISIIYGHYFILLSITIISLWAMVRANRRNQWFWWLVSWVGAGFNMFALEYFIGLEFLRPILLWWLNGKEKNPEKKRLQITIIQWIPYLVLIICYVIWRFFILTSSRYGVGVITSMESEPYGTLIVFFQTLISDLVEVAFLAWEQIFQGPFLLIGRSETQTLYRWVVAATGFFTFLYLLKLPAGSSEETKTMENNPGNQKTMILLGIFFMVCAGVPIWAVPLKLDLSFSVNRFTLPLMIGASITLVGLIELITKSRSKKILIVALMVGLAAGFHLRTATSFQIESKHQKDFIWNLVWRIPYLDPGTVILGDDYPFQYSDDEAIAALVNLAYQSDNHDDEVMPYGFFFVTDALGGYELPALEEGLPVVHHYGPITFSGTTSQAILVHYPGDSCLRVLNPMYDDLGQNFSGMLSEGIQLSDPNNILEVKNKINNRNLFLYFGEEPPKTWCYRYQKAELARQYGQWKRIARIGDQAFEYGYLYQAPEELFPFIEGYARAGEYERAANLSFEALSNTRTLRPQLCAIWDRVHAALTSEEGDPLIFYEVSDELECSSLGSANSLISSE